MEFNIVGHPPDNDSNRQLLSERDRKKLQHEFKTHVQQYFKSKLDRGVEKTKVIIYDDMLIIRVGWFLNDSEKYILGTPEGESAVKKGRMEISKQYTIDNLPFYEEKLKAKVIYQNYDVDPAKDFGYHFIIFDQALTE